MIYSTSDYLRDISAPLEIFFNMREKIAPRLKRAVRELTEYDYLFFLLRVTRNLPFGFLIIYLGLIAAFTLTKYTEKQNGVRIAAITTNSMDPAIPVGSIIVSVPSQDYQEKDIVTFKEVSPSTKAETGRLITHRITEVTKNNGYITKGDSNKYPDPGQIGKEKILGKVFVIVPRLGYFEIILKTVPGFVVFVLIPCLLLIINEAKYISSALSPRRANSSVLPSR